MSGFGLQVEQGEIQVHISAPGQPHGPEFWAKRAADRIMSVSKDAPPVIRDQAEAFKLQMHAIILGAMKSAVCEQKLYDAVKVEKFSAEAAHVIRGV